MLYDTADDDDADEDGDDDDLNNQRQRQLKLGTGAQYWFPARCTLPLSHSLITINISIVIIMITIIVFDVISNLIVIIRTMFTLPLALFLITISIIGVFPSELVTFRREMDPSLENIAHIQRFSSWISKLPLAALYCSLTIG